ncbi:MAG: DUF262 domain-containing protein [Pyrinomonadaceae bacterium]
MNIKPVYATVGELFRSRPMFYVPKYQRAYAWEADPISDFIKDLNSCIDKRKAGHDVKHFLGGILSVEHDVAGVINQHKYEIIDGQQRIATLCLLAASLIATYKELEIDAGNAGQTSEQLILGQRIQDLTHRFFEFQQEVNNNLETADVLTLSKADDSFYRLLIRRMPCDSSLRDSHKRLEKAYSSLDENIKAIVNQQFTLNEKISELKIVETVLLGDFTVIHMVVDKRKDAYTLFQVINDRGANLTDGDLLRAKTLEILENFDNEQNAVEALWDKILVDPPSETNNYLNWIYESYQGTRTAQNVLFDMFLDKFFPQHQQYNLGTFTVADAQALHSTVERLYKDILHCRKLVQGQWPFERRRPITGWDITRLNLLLVDLDHSLSIPLFLAASNLTHTKFSEIVQMVERTFFRYKLIANQHAASLKAIYLQESLAIRTNPGTYDVNHLKTKLDVLINTKAGDAVFQSGLAALQYQESGGNKPLKYFLMSIEYYYQWYKAGAVGIPKCSDKSRVYDFTGTSIEHVYPKRAAPTDATLEPLKNTLGNLTIMDPKPNSTSGNDDFATKKPVYSASSVELTQEIGAKATWTTIEISAHQALLIGIALKVFRP